MEDNEGGARAARTGFTGWLRNKGATHNRLAPLIQWVRSDASWPSIGRHKRRFRDHLIAQAASPEVMSSLDAAFSLYQSNTTKGLEGSTRRVRKTAKRPGTVELDTDLSDLLRSASPLFREEVEGMLALLRPRERRVLQMRFGLVDDQPRTLQEVAEHFKLSRERIRQIQAEALKKLRLPAR